MASQGRGEDGSPRSRLSALDKGLADRFRAEPYGRRMASGSGNAARRLRSPVSGGYVCHLDTKACVSRSKGSGPYAGGGAGIYGTGHSPGLGPTLSHALSGALAEVNPPIREIPTRETMNRLTDKGLATEYADMRAGFARNGMLDRQQLRRIGSGLGSQYVLLPGLAQFGEEILDKFEAAGIKLVRNRVTTLRLWLQLWDTQTGHIVWESSGEGTTSTVFLSPKQTVTLEQIAKKLLVRMIQDGLLDSKTETRSISDQ